MKLISSAQPTGSYFIMESKIVDGTRLFRVRWFAYLPEYNTKEPLESFDDPRIATNFLSNQNLRGE